MCVLRALGAVSNACPQGIEATNGSQLRRASLGAVTAAGDRLMAGTLARADIRGYYEALGVELPGWAQAEASVRCFADPDAHAHQDRNASCSVNLETGAWRCWGCGARGGAYDAAIALGRTPRAAIDLMIHHGLTERRSPAPLRRRRRADAEPKSRRSVPHPQPRRRAWPPPKPTSPAGIASSPRSRGRRRFCGPNNAGCGRAARCSSSAAAGHADG